MKSKFIEKIGFFLLVLSMIITVLFLIGIVYFITSRGLGAISWEFLTSVPRKGMTAGGVAPAILGTFYLTLGAIIFALPLGLACAIYLNEYSLKRVYCKYNKNEYKQSCRSSFSCFRTFRLAVFVKFFGFGVSILSGSLTWAY